MSLIASFAAVLAAATSLVLVLVVLLQQPRGAGLAGVFGRSGDEVLGPTATLGARRLTSAIASVWLAACLLCAFAA